MQFYFLSSYRNDFVSKRPVSSALDLRTFSGLSFVLQQLAACRVFAQTCLYGAFIFPCQTFRSNSTLQENSVFTASPPPVTNQFDVWAYCLPFRPHPVIAVPKISLYVQEPNWKVNQITRRIDRNCHLRQPFVFK